MIEMMIVACLISDPATCVKQPAEIEPYTTLQQCLDRGDVHVRSFEAMQTERLVSHWSCIDDDRSIHPGYAIREIADGVFVHRGAIALPTSENANDLSNASFVIGDESVAVIDSGGSAEVGQRLLNAIRDRTDKPVTHLILTHMHPDHVLGATVFQQAGARIVGHARLSRALSMRATTYEASMRNLIADAYEGSKIVLPDVAVVERLDIDLGNRRLIIRAQPTAHTDNDVTILDEKTGTLFLGDLLFHGHTPALDGSIKGWTGLLPSLMAEDVKRVVPGHGPESLDWPDGAMAMSAYLARLTTDIRQAISEGRTMTDAVRHVGQDLRPDWYLFDEFHPRNVTTVYKELEWE